MHRPDLALFVAFVFSIFSRRGFCYDESPWQPSYDYYHIDLGELGGRHGGPIIKVPVPKDLMVDVINDLGINLLAIHNERNDNNIAISPYGALSVLAALSEGVQGDAVHEILHAAHIPKDRHVIRVGLRDIHRHLKSYFIPEEGFLAGLTLNLNNVTLRREYEDVLRFYGFDYGSFNNALYSEPGTTQKPVEGSTLGTTLGLSEGTTMITTQKKEDSTVILTDTRFGAETETSTNQGTTGKEVTRSTIQGNEETTTHKQDETTTIDTSRAISTVIPTTTKPTIDTVVTETTTESITTTVPKTTTIKGQETTIKELLLTSGSLAKGTTEPVITTMAQQETTTEIPATIKETSVDNPATEGVSISTKISKVTKKTSESSFELSAVSTYLLDTTTLSLNPEKSITTEAPTTKVQETTAQKVTDIPIASTIFLTTTIQPITTTTQPVTATPTDIASDTTTPTQDITTISLETTMITQKFTDIQRTTRQISTRMLPNDQFTTVPIGESTVALEETTVPVVKTTVAFEESTVSVGKTTVPPQTTTLLELTTTLASEKPPTISDETITQFSDIQRTTKQISTSMLPNDQFTTVPIRESTVALEETTVPVVKTTVAFEESTVSVGKTTVPPQTTTLLELTTTLASEMPLTTSDETITQFSDIQRTTRQISTSMLPNDQLTTVPIEESTVALEETAVPIGKTTITLQESTVSVGKTTVSLQTTTLRELTTTLRSEMPPTISDETNTQTPQEVENTVVPFINSEVPFEVSNEQNDLSTSSANTPTQIFDQSSENVDTTTTFFFETTPDFQDITTFNQDNFDYNYNYDANTPLDNNSAVDQVPPAYEDNMANFVNNNLLMGEPEGASLNRNLKRRARSVVDYVIARYYDDRHPYPAPLPRSGYPPQQEFPQYIPQPEPPIRPHQYVPQQEPLTFAVYGKYRESGINFMKYDTVLPFFFVPNLKALALSFPLDSTKYYLLLLLPVEDNGVDQLVCDLRLHGNLRYIIEHLRPTHVVATIPSFMLKGYVTLTPLLQRLGIRRIFEPRQADFSPMTNVTDIYVTNIEQAVTVTIRNYLDPSAQHYKNFRQYSPVHFKADHPFLYFVIDSDLHVALMVGKVINPLNSRIR